LCKHTVSHIEVELIQPNIAEFSAVELDRVDVLPESPNILGLVDLSHSPGISSRQLVGCPKLPELSQRHCIRE
jgi:hypothetical protein